MSGARLLVALLGVTVLAGTASGASGGITVLSSRPDMVSGGDALLAVRGAGAITVNGIDVSANFRGTDDGRRVGLVDGLAVGANTVRAGTATLMLTNHPLGGPLFSGPHETPFACMTDAFQLPASRQTLGAPLDADCSVKTRVDYVYRSSSGAFKPLPGDAMPADIAMTATSRGSTVPYVVRVETGTIDRAIYQTAVLATPGAVDPRVPPPSWNGRLVYTFGGGCVGGWNVQGSNVGNRGILEDLMLRQGYAVASSSLNVFGNNCAPVLAAEVVSMVKERFIETYGVPQFTIGFGCSGGSEQLHPIADNYPGLVDGIIVGCSFPEVSGAMILNLADADLMTHYFRDSTLAWSDDARAAAGGYPNATTAGTIGPLAVRIKAEGGTCKDAIGAATRFSRAGNPSGVRCDIYDHAVNILGRDPATGAARRPWDNVGVQYGLGALTAGAISARQFLDLNRAIGGFDNDGNYVAARSQADPLALERVYASGQVTYGGLGLRSTPIIDYRGYVDAPENADENHSRFHSFSMRARLEKVNGSAGNQVMLVESGLPGTRGLFSDDSPVLSRALTQMDQWLSALDFADGARPRPAEIVRAKPADLADACFTDGGTVRIAEKQIYRGATRCNSLYPAYASPRMVAGGPLTNDVLKCRLKPVDDADYAGRLSRDELAELRGLFRDGVCDYRKPGVGQAPPKRTWQSY